MPKGNPAGYKNNIIEAIAQSMMDGRPVQGEDDADQVWDARRRGNGEGQSFIDVGGEMTPLDDGQNLKDQAMAVLESLPPEKLQELLNMLAGSSGGGSGGIVERIMSADQER